eukprot:gene4090-14191_t
MIMIMSNKRSDNGSIRSSMDASSSAKSNNHDDAFEVRTRGTGTHSPSRIDWCLHKTNAPGGLWLTRSTSSRAQRRNLTTKVTASATTGTQLPISGHRPVLRSSAPIVWSHGVPNPGATLDTIGAEGNLLVTALSALLPILGSQGNSFSAASPGLDQVAARAKRALSLLLLPKKSDPNSTSPYYSTAATARRHSTSTTSSTTSHIAVPGGSGTARGSGTTVHTGCDLDPPNSTSEGGMGRLDSLMLATYTSDTMLNKYKTDQGSMSSSRPPLVDVRSDIPDGRAVSSMGRDLAVAGLVPPPADIQEGRAASGMERDLAVAGRVPPTADILEGRAASGLERDLALVGRVPPTADMAGPASQPHTAYAQEVDRATFTREAQAPSSHPPPVQAMEDVAVEGAGDGSRGSEGRKSVPVGDELLQLLAAAVMNDDQSHTSPPGLNVDLHDPPYSNLIEERPPSPYNGRVEELLTKLSSLPLDVQQQIKGQLGIVLDPKPSAGAGGGGSSAERLQAAALSMRVAEASAAVAMAGAEVAEHGVGEVGGSGTPSHRCYDSRVTASGKFRPKVQNSFESRVNAVNEYKAQIHAGT